MRSSCRSSLTAIAIAIVLTRGSSPAQASAPASDRKVLVWPLAVDAELAPAAHAELAGAVRTGLARADVTIADVEPSQSTAAASCTDIPCISAIARAQEVRWVVRPSLQVDDRNFAIEATLLDANTGTTIATVTATCELCGTAEVAEELSHQIAALARRLERIEPEPARLVLATEPRGAEITLDGRDVGRTPRTLTLPAGRHRLLLRKPGFLPVLRSIELFAGVDERIELELARARRPFFGAGMGLLVGSFALAGAGAALWTIDGRPYRGRCSGDDRDYAGRCRFSYDTKTAGIVLVSFAVAAAFTGIGLLIESRRRTRAR